MIVDFLGVQTAADVFRCLEGETVEVLRPLRKSFLSKMICFFTGHLKLNSLYLNHFCGSFVSKKLCRVLSGNS